MTTSALTNFLPRPRVASSRDPQCPPGPQACRRMTSEPPACDIERLIDRFHARNEPTLVDFGIAHFEGGFVTGSG